LALFRDAGWDVAITDPIKDPDALASALADCDAVLVRSSTRITHESLKDATRLKVIGRAGREGCCSTDSRTAASLPPTSAADKRCGSFPPTRG
jgi:phosphoglycerate dehydrogenase-like enzyme